MAGRGLMGADRICDLVLRWTRENKAGSFP